MSASLQSNAGWSSSLLWLPGSPFQAHSPGCQAAPHSQLPSQAMPALLLHGEVCPGSQQDRPALSPCSITPKTYPTRPRSHLPGPGISLCRHLGQGQHRPALNSGVHVGSAAVSAWVHARTHPSVPAHATPAHTMCSNSARLGQDWPTPRPGRGPAAVLAAPSLAFVIVPGS